MQEAKDKEKKMKAAGVEGGAGIEELHLQIETLTSEKVEEEELRNYMQLERVGSLYFVGSASGAFTRCLPGPPLHCLLTRLMKEAAYA